MQQTRQGQGEHEIELYVPMAHLMYGGSGLPLNLVRTMGAAVRGPEIGEIGHIFGGRAAKPKKPILMYGPDSRVMHVIMADGQTEAAELAEAAQEAYELAVARVRETGRAINMDERRERAGLARREEFGALAAQALRERAARHIANPISDPARQVRWG